MSTLSESMIKQLKDQILETNFETTSTDVGTIYSVGDGIALVRGLDNILANELVHFKDDVYGLALNLSEGEVGVVILGDDSDIREGDVVYRTQKIIEVNVGDALLGRVVDALGRPIDNKGPIETEAFMPIERIAPGVMTRQSVNEPLYTGIKVIDAMIPLGKGQRELIIGDRQTGKTSMALNAIINQKNQNVKCIYVAIGQKASTIAQVVDNLEKQNALSYTTIVVAGASEMAPLQYIAPFTGVAMGEYWMDNGDDVLIVFDDLSKHAVAYRSISLLLRRPSGREAYPGDIFYLHSRLLERAAKLNDKYGGGSMTALPIIETQAGDISAYIPTNVISITDGQLFLNTDQFNAGQRPAVDSGMSVSRVGSAAQTSAMKKMSASLKLQLATYDDMLAFAQFSSDIDDATKKILDRGVRIRELLKQPALSNIDHGLMIFSMALNHFDYLDQLDISEVRAFEALLHENLRHSHKVLLKKLEKDTELTDGLISEMKSAIEASLKTFKATQHAKS